MNFAQMTWFNPPPGQDRDADDVSVTTAPATDFWMETFYGFTRHSGHHLCHPVTGDFTARVTVAADYRTLYDQAGLMLRLDETHWIKAGVEHTDGQPVFSTVVTDGLSDWATLPLTIPASPLTLRLTRHGGAVRVDLQDAGGWRMARLAHLPDGPAIPRALHEDHP